MVLKLIIQLLQTARRHFAEGGERIRYTFPPLIASGIQLARRFKQREHVVSDYSHIVNTG
jgi:vacuolar protein sorting-associated protein 35